MDEIERSDEARLLEAMINDPELSEDEEARHSRLTKKNEVAIENFLGEEPHAVAVFSHKWYYWRLLAWQLHTTLKKGKWQIKQTCGYVSEKPWYADIDKGAGARVNCLTNGQVLVEKDDEKLLITIDVRSNGGNFIQVETFLHRQKMADKFIKAIAANFKKYNFYKGNNILLNGSGLIFVEAGKRDWDSVILDPVTKREIQQNTIGFLRKLEVWQKYGIPAKRGIILAGSPGTGKTIVCKALATEAEGITCLFVDPCGMPNEGYISYVYEIAQELSPCIVFIEDIDLIGQERMYEGYRNSSVLISLLNEMDGISEVNGIVTVATTNGLETLDKALVERPSRFDRLIRIPHPADDMRAALIDHLSLTIPLSPETKSYLAEKTAGFSPAQIQETIFSMVITGSEGEDDDATLELTPGNVDAVLGIMNTRKPARAIGFQTIGYPCPVNSGQQNRRQGE